MTLEKVRQLVKQRIETKLGNDGGKIYLADWDKRRIAWEDTILGDLYYSHMDSFHEILDQACEGTGYYIELCNSVEGQLYK